MLNEVYRSSPTRALKLSKAIVQRKTTAKNGEAEAHSLIDWGRGAGTRQRRMVCRAFRESRSNVLMVHGISELQKRDARAYMKDYFAAGGDMKSVVQWLQVVGHVMRKHRGKQPDTDGFVVDAAKWVADKVEDTVDAIGDAVNAVVDAVVSAGKSLANALAEAAGWAVDKVTDLVDALIEAGKRAADILAEALRKGVAVLQKFVKALIAAGRTVREIMTWVARQAINTVKAVVKALAGAGRSVAEIMREAVKFASNALKAAAQALWQATKKLADILVSIARKAASIIRTVLEGLLAVGVQLVAAVREICAKVAGGFRKGFFEGLIALGKTPLAILKAALKAGGAILGLAVAVFMEIWGGHRPLTAAERKEAKRVFGASIDLSRVKVAVASVPADIVNWLNGNRPFTTMYIINFASGTRIDMGTLIHELTHVWQGVVAGPVYMVEALHSQFFGRGYQVTDADLDAANGKLAALEREQQAVVVERYWRYRWGGGSGDWRKYYPLARQVYKAATTRAPQRYRRDIPVSRRVSPRVVRVAEPRLVRAR